jgi:hypothetical protein
MEKREFNTLMDFFSAPNFPAPYEHYNQVIEFLRPRVRINLMYFSALMRLPAKEWAETAEVSYQTVRRTLAIPELLNDVNLGVVEKLSRAMGIPTELVLMRPARVGDFFTRSLIGSHVRGKRPLSVQEGYIELQLAIVDRIDWCLKKDRDKLARPFTLAPLPARARRLPRKQMPKTFAGRDVAPARAEAVRNLCPDFETKRHPDEWTEWLFKEHYQGD